MLNESLLLKLPSRFVAGIDGQAAVCSTVSDGSSGELSAVTAVDLPGTPRPESSPILEPHSNFKLSQVQKRSKLFQQRWTGPSKITR